MVCIKAWSISNQQFSSRTTATMSSTSGRIIAIFALIVFSHLVSPADNENPTSVQGSDSDVVKHQTLYFDDGDIVIICPFREKGKGYQHFCVDKIVLSRQAPLFEKETSSSRGVGFDEEESSEGSGGDEEESPEGDECDEEESSGGITKVRICEDAEDMGGFLKALYEPL